MANSAVKSEDGRDTVAAGQSPQGRAESGPFETPGLLRGLWYYAVPGHRVRRGQTMHRTLLGEPVLIGRDKESRVFAIRDICPHRGIPLSDGRYDGHEVECCYHGWRFDREGVCTTIPSLVKGQKFEPARCKVRSYPVRESQGNVWIYMGADGASESDLPPVPRVPYFGDRSYSLVRSVRFSSHMDQAAIGLMDPVHGPFVHKSFYWRSPARMLEKTKKFEPSYLGWTMVRHPPSTNGRMYKLMPGKRETEISFQLPGIRIEHIRAGDRQVCGLTAVTPVDDKETELHHAMYWNMPWLTAFKPLAMLVAKLFIDQDRRAAAQQQEGLKYDPALMLIDDSDKLAKWYFRCKREFVQAQAEHRAFENPVQATTLRWRS